MQNLKLSILVAAYNEEENLRSFFDFWLDQDYGNYEILIVNDGSKDDTEKIVLSYAEKYKGKVRLINNDRNRGVGYTRYNGFIHADGEVIKFSDADIAPDYPHQRDLITRLMTPFNENPKVDIGYIDYYPFFDRRNLVRSIENFYYYSPVLETPNDYKNRKIPSLHMPTLFRNKSIDLSGVKNIKNGEDRFIAISFLKEAKVIGKSEGNIILDVNNGSFDELYKRYVSYGKNSLGFFYTNKKMFFIHILKPIILIGSVVFALLGILFARRLYTFPLILIYFGFLGLTLNYLRYYKKESKCLLFQILFFGPFFLMLRYIFVFIGLLKIR